VGEAEAAAIQKKGEAEAEVMRQKAEAFKQYGEAAIVQSIVDKVSSLQAHNLIPIYTNSDYCLAASCT
jgi:flotillin